jgi:hypothetical protein
VRAASIIRAIMMEAARTSETSVDIDLRTLQYVPEDSEFHTRRSENLKSHIMGAMSVSLLFSNFVLGICIKFDYVHIDQV